MPNKQKSSQKRVFFNASVVLAGFRSPTGGSAKLLAWSKAKKINGIVSEIVVDEVARHASKIGFAKNKVKILIETTFGQIETAPEAQAVEKYRKIVVDPGDAHILASCNETQMDFLVTLDKKHLLILQKKIKWVRIVSPAELIDALS